MINFKISAPPTAFGGIVAMCIILDVLLQFLAALSLLSVLFFNFCELGVVKTNTKLTSAAIGVGLLILAIGTLLSIKLLSRYTRGYQVALILIFTTCITFVGLSIALLASFAVGQQCTY